MFKSQEISEILECMILCHESESRSSRKFSSFVQEERALIDMCGKMGVFYEVCKKHPSSNFIKSIKKKVNGYVEDQLNIAGINGFSSSRMRMSVVVNHQSRGKNSFVLYARGKDQKIIDILNLSQQDKAQLKKILVKIKNLRLKVIVLAKKDLSVELAAQYIQAHHKIVDAKKN